MNEELLDKIEREFDKSDERRARLATMARISRRIKKGTQR